MQSRTSRPLLTDVVRAALRDAIMSGEFPPESKLPNEDQLRDQFNVSRITLREAVRGLMEEGYVVRRQGAGTFVTYRPKLRNSLDTNFSYSDYLESAGATASKKILSAKLVRADADTAQALSVAEGDEVIELRRVRMAGRSPAIYSIDYLPAPIADIHADTQLFHGSLYGLLSERGHAVDHGEATITPVVADRELAQLLKVSEGTPLQHIDQIDFDRLGAPVMRSREWHVPTVIELRVYRRGPGPTRDAASAN